MLRDDRTWAYLRKSRQTSRQTNRNINRNRLLSAGTLSPATRPTTKQQQSKRTAIGRAWGWLLISQIQNHKWMAGSDSENCEWTTLWNLPAWKNYLDLKMKILNPQSPIIELCLSWSLIENSFWELRVRWVVTLADPRVGMQQQGEDLAANCHSALPTEHPCGMMWQGKNSQKSWHKKRGKYIRPSFCCARDFEKIFAVENCVGKSKVGTNSQK